MKEDKHFLAYRLTLFWSIPPMTLWPPQSSISSYSSASQYRSSTRIHSASHSLYNLSVAHSGQDPRKL